MSEDRDRPVQPGNVELFIHGETTAPLSGEYLDSVNPATGEVAYRVARGGPEDVDLAVRDARAAAAPWAEILPVDRGRIMYRIGEAILDEADNLAWLESLDNGKPLGQARADVVSSARYFEYYAGMADKLHGDTFPLGPNYVSYSRLEPFGVTAHILPWNAPLQQAARGIAPALTVGNTVVAKPAEDTSVSCLRLAQIAYECGLPPGVMNVVTGTGREVGEPLTRHREVDKIAFTGSLATGQAVMSAASERVLSVTLELGGKSPNIVFEDADLDEAARGVTHGINLNAGQICSAGTRVLAHVDIIDELTERVVAIQRRLKLGSGVSDPDMGPMTTKDQWQKVQAYLLLAREEGATVALGGGVPTQPDLAGGFFIEPTVLVNVDNSMRVAQEEIFGPVLAILPFRDDDEAVAIANDSDFGLVAGIWTNDLKRAHSVAARLQAGQVFVNEYFAGGVETPFGGYKRSGIGREKGIEGLRHYLQHKTVTVRL